MPFQEKRFESSQMLALCQKVFYIKYMLFLMVGAGGFLGSLCRYCLSLVLVTGSGFPWSTLIVNFLGCLAIAFLSLNKSLSSPGLFLFLVPGFLGAFTTFSAFGLETIKLAQTQRIDLALLNIVLNLLLGLGAVWFVFKIYTPEILP
jgi:fluoride exporter